LNLHVYIEDEELEVTLPSSLLEDAAEFFNRMDSDMDKGWQMGREWVEHPNQEQRCQIAADKLLGAIENNNDDLKMLMAGYILSRVPQIDAVRVDTSGEMQETRFFAYESND